MEGQSNVLLIILLFILRLGIPVLVTVAIAYGLRRLDAKWQAEAEASEGSDQESLCRKHLNPNLPGSATATAQASLYRCASLRGNGCRTAVLEPQGLQRVQCEPTAQHSINPMYPVGPPV